jgi:rhamnulokinase
VNRFLAVDLGATSVRVCAVGVPEPGESTEDGSGVEVVHRAAHQPIMLRDGSLRWEWPLLVDEVQRGLERGLATGPVTSIGVDGWGVDYGLIGTDGRLLSSPHSYRSARTERWRETVDRIGEDRLYAINGIQQMPINTIYQLAVHDPAELESADRLLMLPELMVHELTGEAHAEISSAGTTGLIDAGLRDWSGELLDEIGVRRTMFCDLSPVGTPAGRWRGIPVRLTAGHDTACAVAGLPSSSGAPSAFVCTGSWLLVGTQLPAANRSAQARSANFSNEPDPMGGVRFLKNVNGFAILERLREAWSVPSVSELVAAADTEQITTPLDVGDSELVNGDTEAAVRRGAKLPASAGRARVVGAVIDGMARAVSHVVDEIDALIGGPVETVRMVGGGVGATRFVELLEDHLGIPVQLGSVEATSIGNVRLQTAGHVR